VISVFRLLRKRHPPPNPKKVVASKHPFRQQPFPARRRQTTNSADLRLNLEVMKHSKKCAANASPTRRAACQCAGDWQTASCKCFAGNWVEELELQTLKDDRRIAETRKIMVSLTRTSRWRAVCQLGHATNHSQHESHLLQLSPMREDITCVKPNTVSIRPSIQPTHPPIHV
jgi:hypothetical protein